MKLLSYYSEDTILPGLLVNRQVFDLSSRFGSTLQLLDELGPDFNTLDSADFQAVGPVDDLELAPPVCFPRKLMCVAGNYIDHLKEGGADPEKQAELMQAPWMFLVPPTTVMVGHRQNVLYPKKANQIDYEGELAVVIGKRCKDISEDDANDVIAGYTIFNDVSERKPYMIEDVEKPRQLSFWYKKGFDTFGPTGPWITHRDNIDPQNVTIRSYINGEEKQSCHTSEMIFTVKKLIAFLSGFMTLEPGDIISTGTPSGVGMASGSFLSAGDNMSIRIDGLGELENDLV
jgi:2-keto-4-pentenoate hydratase/2-oxohepta-3-ene-1,7-dioic acid hydratase in catechol pathway